MDSSGYLFKVYLIIYILHSLLAIIDMAKMFSTYFGVDDTAFWIICSWLMIQLNFIFSTVDYIVLHGFEKHS